MEEYGAFGAMAALSSASIRSRSRRRRAVIEYYLNKVSQLMPMLNEIKLTPPPLNRNI